MKLSIIYVAFLAIFSYSCNGEDTNEKASTNQDQVALKIDPNQCEEPWIQFAGNSREEKMTNYLSSLNIELINYKEEAKDIMACAACGCPGLTVYTVTVDKKHQAQLEGEGFSIVSN